MDITRHNQGVALAEFEHALSNCEFCAIDQEMTGVDVPGQSTLFGAPPAEVYRAKREATLAYNAFQFGIALFTRTGEESYDVRPYNFYLLNEQGDIRLSLSAISFLAENHMNFQKWLTSGMNYCTRDIEKERMETFRFDESTDDVFLSLKTQIELWYQGESTEELCVEVRCSARAARAIAVKLNTMDSFHVSTRYGGNPSHAENIVFSIRKLDAAAWSLERHRRVSVESEKQSVSLGFRKFWKLIVDSKKEIVGHNFAQDLMFMVNMHEEVLPASYEEFKLLVAKLFPRIYDTKTMARHVPGDNSFQNTHLGGLYTECRKRLESNPIQFSSLFRLPAGFYSYGDTSLEQCSKAHEAAYDAYMTGIVFSCLRNLLKQRTDTICNMISSFGSSYYVCINGSDVLVCRDTFLIDSRKECSVEDIKAIFYLMDDHQTNSPAAPKDFVPYQIMGCQRSSSQLFVSFSLVYPGSEVGVMCEKPSSLSESDFLQHNADFSIVGGLSISRLMDGFPS